MIVYELVKEECCKVVALEEAEALQAVDEVLEDILAGRSPRRLLSVSGTAKLDLLAFTYNAWTQWDD